MSISRLSYAIALIVCVWSNVLPAQNSPAELATEKTIPSLPVIPGVMPEKLEPDARQIGAQFHQMVSTSEWLGPLAPIAMSPFFGLACISGTACYGPDWLQSRSQMFSSRGPLANPTLFWALLGLTIATSLPRFFKVSKPLALLAEKIEAYSAIIILFLTRMIGSELSEGTGVPSLAVVLPFVSANPWQVPIDVLMGLAAAINVLVVNLVKLFFEFLIWIVPVPFLDAIFELANKSACLGLLAVYSFSPALATVINLIILAGCLISARWIKRRITCWRTLFINPVLARLVPRWFAIDSSQLVVFSSEPFDGVARFTKLVLRYENSGSGTWELLQPGWFGIRRRLPSQASPLRASTSLVGLQIEWPTSTGQTVRLLHRRLADAELQQLQLRIQVEATESSWSPSWLPWARTA